MVGHGPHSGHPMNIQAATSGSIVQCLPLPAVTLVTSPSAITRNNPQTVSQIGISSQRIQLNVSSNNDSLARMKCKNSIREVLGLGKDNRKQRKPLAEASGFSISKGNTRFNKQTPVAAASSITNDKGDEKKNEIKGQGVVIQEESKGEGDGKKLDDEDENKSSDIFNADAGSYYNQKGMLGFQSTGGDPTFDGVMNTPNF